MISAVRRALVTAPLMPEFDRESGSRRVFHVIGLLCDLGWRVAFVPENPLGGERYRRILEQMGVAVYHGWGDPKERLEAVIGTEKFDVAIFFFWYHAEAYSGRVRELSPQTTILIDSIDLHFLRNARRGLRSAPEARNGVLLDSGFGEETARELSAYASADGVLTVSRKEADLIADFCGDTTLAHVVPDFEELESSSVSWSARKGSVFVANFRHPPNIEAAEFLCESIAPRVDRRAANSWPISIVGNDAEKCLKGISNVPPGVGVVGWVPAVEPRRAGARESCSTSARGGTKRKLVHSLMLGTPAVSTSVGVEGLDLAEGEGVLVRDDPTDFAEAISLLSSDRKTWAACARAGRRAVLRRHGRAQAGASLEAAIEASMRRAGRRRGKRERPFSKQREYRALVGRIGERIATLGADGDEPVLVVSRGDPELIDIEGVVTWHYPGTEDGKYFGSYPANGADAVELLEAAIGRGARALVVPRTSFWWLEHYTELRQRLEARHDCDPRGRRLPCLQTFGTQLQATGPLPANALLGRKSTRLWSRRMKPLALVTGGAGFIGSYIVQPFARGGVSGT